MTTKRWGSILSNSALELGHAQLAPPSGRRVAAKNGIGSVWFVYVESATVRTLTCWFPSFDQRRGLSYNLQCLDVVGSFLLRNSGLKASTPRSLRKLSVARLLFRTLIRLALCNFAVYAVNKSVKGVFPESIAKGSSGRQEQAPTETFQLRSSCLTQSLHGQWSGRSCWMSWDVRVSFTTTRVRNQVTSPETDRCVVSAPFRGGPGYLDGDSFMEVLARSWRFFFFEGLSRRRTGVKTLIECARFTNCRFCLSWLAFEFLSSMSTLLRHES